MKSFFTITILFFTIQTAVAFSWDKMDEIDSLMQRIDRVLDEDWFINREADTITISFCRSCHVIDSTNYNTINVTIHSGDTVRKEVVKRYKNRPFHNFSLKGPDSVRFQTLINPAISITEEDKKAKYKADDVLEVKIWFSDEWSEERFKRAYNLNQKLLTQIRIGDPYFICSLYESQPDSNSYNRYLGRTSHTLQQLPYFSVLTSKAIFIDNPCSARQSYPVYIDKNDPNGYRNPENFLSEEFRNVMYSMAYALGIMNFRE